MLINSEELSKYLGDGDDTSVLEDEIELKPWVDDDSMSDESDHILEDREKYDALGWMPSEEAMTDWRKFSPVEEFRAHQEAVIGAILNGWRSGKKFAVVEAPTGCHAKGTQILMFDGNLKNVEDIVVGDLLMGPDSTPRQVLDLHHGQQEMVKIVPTKGDPFVVNLDHILSLQRTNTASSTHELEDVKRRKDYKGKNPTIAISVRNWLTQSKTFKHTYKLYRTGVEFKKQDFKFKIPPYILGVWLGNGTSTVAAITNIPNEVVDAWERFGDENGCKVSVIEKKKDCAAATYLLVRKEIKGAPLNMALSLFRDLNLLDNKHVPFPYLVASRQDRLDLLAGLIDTDGSFATGCFDIVQKRKNLAESIAFVARSLDFAAYLTETRKKSQYGTWGTYYRVSISGDVSEIPTRVSHKKADKRLQVKNVLRTGFKVEMLPKDDFFGFTVDKDNLYLMGDFTVTHNSGKSIYSIILGKLFGLAYLATPQKILQTQYMNDFPDTLFELKGRANYPCLRLNKDRWLEKNNSSLIDGDEIGDYEGDPRPPRLGTDYITLDTYKSLSEEHPQRMLNCANGHCLKEQKKIGAKLIAECRAHNVCEYIRRRDYALHRHPFTLMNFSNLILFTRLMEKRKDLPPDMHRLPYDTRPLLILDECHTLESSLYEYASLTITVRKLKPLRLFMEESSITRLTKPFTCMEDVIDYLKIVQKACNAFVKAAALEEKKNEAKRWGKKSAPKVDTETVTIDMDSDDDADGSDSQHVVDRIIRLATQISNVLISEPTSHTHVIVPEEMMEKDHDIGSSKKVIIGFKIIPFSVASLHSLAFGASSSRVLLMSATILDPVVFYKSLGISPSDAFFIRVPSTFPPGNRIVIGDTTIGSMAYKHKAATLPNMLDKILELTTVKHDMHKGIIHTGNYENMLALQKWVKSLGDKSLRDRILFQSLDGGYAKKEAIIARHIASSEPTILCGPGLVEGLNLFDDLARFNILMKVPYASLANPLINRKSREDPDWYALQTALAIIQAMGRSVRSISDWSVIYILDFMWKLFYSEHKDRLFPKYIQESLRWISKSNPTPHR